MTEPPTNTDPSSSRLPEEIESIVVEFDGLLNMLEQNWLAASENQHHILQLTPPYSGEIQAHPHLKRSRPEYPAVIGSGVTNLGGRALLADDTTAQAVPRECRHPSIIDARKRFRDEKGYRTEDGQNRELTAAEEREWDAWWEGECEDWEESVRDHLRDDVLLVAQSRGDSLQISIPVQYNS